MIKLELTILKWVWSWISENRTKLSYFGPKLTFDRPILRHVTLEFFFCLFLKWHYTSEIGRTVRNHRVHGLQSGEPRELQRAKNAQQHRAHTARSKKKSFNFWANWLPRHLTIFIWKEPVVFTDRIRPACLPDTSAQVYFGNTKAVMSTFEASNDTSGALFKMSRTVTLNGSVECEKLLGPQTFDSKLKICSISPKNTTLHVEDVTKKKKLVYFWLWFKKLI